MVSNGEYGGRGNKNWFNKAAANFAKNILLPSAAN